MREWQRLESKTREAVGDYKMFFTERAGHATELATQAIENGFTRIVSCGGDGTHFEVVNGFFRDGAPIDREVEFAIFPLGTGSDLPRTLRIPRKPDAAIPFLTSDSVVLSDVGRLTCFHEPTGADRSCYFITSDYIRTMIASKKYDEVF